MEDIKYIKDKDGHIIEQKTTKVEIDMVELKREYDEANEQQNYWSREMYRLKKIIDEIEGL